MPTTIPSVRRVKNFFFEAMLYGYAGDNKSKQVPQQPEMRYFEYTKGNLSLVDRWLQVETSEWSHGYTNIYLLDGNTRILLWTMIYSGQYNPRVIPFLKKVLRHVYVNKKFWGGRGEDGYKEGSMTYYNNLERPNSFSRFRGEERIEEIEQGSLGSHKYEGHWVLNF